MIEPNKFMNGSNFPIYSMGLSTLSQPKLIEREILKRNIKNFVKSDSSKHISELVEIFEVGVDKIISILKELKAEGEIIVK